MGERESMPYDVVIVGAGPAGLAAAIRLKQRAAATGADVALVNPGSMRADLQPGPLTHERLFAVHPYDFPLVRMRLSGRALAAMLAELRTDGPDVEIYVDGPDRLDPRADYVVSANEWMATGNGFPVLRDAAKLGAPAGSETEALVDHVDRRR